MAQKHRQYLILWVGHYRELHLEAQIDDEKDYLDDHDEYLKFQREHHVDSVYHIIFTRVLEMISKVPVLNPASSLFYILFSLFCIL